MPQILFQPPISVISAAGIDRQVAPQPTGGRAHSSEATVFAASGSAYIAALPRLIRSEAPFPNRNKLLVLDIE